MPLPLPNLDDRRWVDLVDEGRALIPRHAPEWTDHNVHDPGITFMELLAWLSEMTIYQLNRVPRRYLQKFLALIGFFPLMPRAAQTFLSFTPDPGTNTFEIPVGVEFQTIPSQEPTIPFRTLRDLSVAVVPLIAIQVEEFDQEGVLHFHDRTRDWHDGLPIRVLGRTPGVGQALYLGFSELPTEITIALGFRFDGPASDFSERERLIQEAGAQQAVCRRILPDLHCDDEPILSEQTEVLVPAHHSVQLIWEVCTGDNPETWTELERVQGLAKPGSGQVMDDTRSLTLNGILEVNLAPGNVPIAKSLGAIAEPLFYLRCRLVSGVYDSPVMLLDVAPNSVLTEQAVPAVQVFPFVGNVTLSGTAPPNGEFARFDMVVNTEGAIESFAFLDSLNAPNHPDVRVLDYQPPGSITLELVLVGKGSDRPAQRMSLPETPAQIESLRLFTHFQNEWQEWTRRGDLDASTRTDFHFTLDPMSGDLLFGDGERGRIVPLDALILASFRRTKAASGNVSEDTITRPADTPINSLWFDQLEVTLGQQGMEQIKNQLPTITTNRIPAYGGTDAESLTHAIGRAVETLHAHERLQDLCADTKCQTLDQIDRLRVRTLPSPTRAVNLLDFERLALDIPGTHIARARAWASSHPAYPCIQAPGVITLVVLPAMPGLQPVPSPGLLNAVKRFFNRRRIVATRVEVIAPDYLTVRVNARVRTRPYADPVRVRAAIQQAVNGFLHPLHGGPEGLGWPFGRDVYRSEILQVIDNVPSVDHVLELRLVAGDGEPRCGNVALCHTWLVTPGKHHIVVNPSSVRESRLQNIDQIPVCIPLEEDDPTA